MQDKKLIVAVVIIVVLLLGAGGYFAFGRNTNKTNQPVAIEEEIQEISPEDLGLEFTARNDGKAVKVAITKPEGISAVEYTISYTREENGEELPEGLFGEMEIEPGTDIIETEYRELGTCSSGVCRYHKVVSPLELVLKITKDGKIYQAQETLEL